MRRIATVTICVPLASIASRMTSKSRYFPVPSMRRDVNAREPMTSSSAGMAPDSRFPIPDSRSVGADIDLRAFLDELGRLLRHALLGILADLLRDLHRAELRAAHRAEVRGLRAV